MHLRNQGTHQRSVLFPLGNAAYQSVAFGNLVCCRAVLLLAFAMSRKLRVLLEQPQGSKAALHPRLAWFLAHFQASALCANRKVCIFLFGQVWRTRILHGVFSLDKPKATVALFER